MFQKLDVHTVVAVVGTIVGLAVTNGLITNEDGKIVTGAVSGLVALGVLVYGSVKHHTDAKPKPAQFAVTSSGLGGVTVTSTTAPPPAA